MWRTARRCLLAGFVLLTAAASAAGQADDAGEKRAAIRRLLELTAPAKAADTIFRRLVSEYQRPAREAMVADLRAKGLFKRFPPGQAAKMEQLVRETSDRMFEATKEGVSREVFTTENMEAAAAPVLDKHLTVAEVNELVALFESPAGRKVAGLYPELMAEAVYGHLKAKGVYNVSPSSVASLANLGRSGDGLMKESSGQFERLFAKAAAKHLIADELGAFAAFAATPLGRKLQTLFPQMQEEISRAYIMAHAHRVMAISTRVREAELQAFAKRVTEAAR